MTVWRLVFRSFCYHARSHIGSTLGAAVGSAVLIGALVVGDSVRGSLRELALARLGKVELAAATGERLFRTQLAADLQIALAQGAAGIPTACSTASVLDLPGVAIAEGGAARANHLHVLGVDDRFWALAIRPPSFANIPTNQVVPFGGGLFPQTNSIAPEAVVLSEALAAQLHAKPGDSVLLRIQKPTQLSGDAPLAPEEETAAPMRLRVQAIVEDAELGRFGLQASQLAPFNAFVNLDALAPRVGVTNRANLLLVGEPANPLPRRLALPPNVNPLIQPMQRDLQSMATLLLRQRWQVEDAQLEWRYLPAIASLELRSSRIFFDPQVANSLVGGGHSNTNSVGAMLPKVLPGVSVGGVLTYLVNEIRLGDRATPYSMVTAIDAPVSLPDLADDEIQINDWLAEDLGAKPGDELTLTYYVVGLMRQLEERTTQFRVKNILPINAPGVDRDLMPDFPGLTQAKSCRDWDTGLPIHTDRIRPKDEAYWRDYRGTPKAFVNLSVGRKLWGNRFGDLTAVRFYPNSSLVTVGQSPARSRSLANDRQTLSRLILGTLNPASLGLGLQSVRAQALAASAEGEDYGSLFLGFSFFLIAAALLLVAVLYQFAIEQRAGEVGTLLALGFTPRKVRRILLFEGGLVALAGALIGTWAGQWYAQAMLRGLSSIWRQAVGGATLNYHADAGTLGMGVGASWMVMMITMALALKRQARQPARELLAEGSSGGDLQLKRARGRYGRGIWVAASGGALAAGLLLAALAQRHEGGSEYFFCSGAALLLAGMGLCSAWLTRLGSSEAADRLTVRSMGIRSLTRRRRRSLATMGLLACGSFLVVAVGVFRLEEPQGAGSPGSGTGGFALIGESTQPITQDLNGRQGRDAFGLDASALADASVIPLRVKEGDDASCLNLNRAQTPRLLGVRPDLLQKRHSFTFNSAAAGFHLPDGWDMLSQAEDQDIVPAIGDEASVVWSLGRKVGDDIPYTDEHGRTFKLRVVATLSNSILQGSLLIAEDQFVRRFPSTSGYRMFLLDAPSNSVDRLSAELTNGLKDLGLELTPASRRLAAFNAVQNTYLGTFQVLGGLGLVLGSVGLGVVVLRNVLERRGELALLRALGFTQRALSRLVLSEHVALLIVGLSLGVIAALVAVAPFAFAAGSRLPIASLSLTFAAVLLNGILWTWAAATAALRGPMLDALREN